MLALGCLLAAGCFGKGPPRGEVSGTVSLDGQPLPDGTIVFIPHGDTKGPTAGGSIKDGEYHIPRKRGVVVGENRVEIRWGKPTGKRIQDPMNPGGMLEETKEGIPARYNLQSELIRQIKSGSNSGEDFNFDLQSGAK